MDKVQLLQVVECPACQAGLTDWKACRACGITFDADGDTPRLMAKNATRLVSFDFAATRSVVPDERQVELLRYPPRSPKKKAPYHLDAAHAQVLEGLEPGKTILDIGCGGGQMRTYVEGLGHEYVGIDISKTRVHEWLQEHGGPDLLADAHFLPFKSATFDVIYSAAVTEHLACPQLVAQQIHRALRPGGLYLGNCSFMEPWHDDSFYHMSPLGVIELLTQVEFEIDHVWPGVGYSGYRALMRMGNSVTKRVSLIGDAVFGVYRLGGYMKKKLRPASSRPVFEAARVAGAIDWIAHKPTTDD